MYRYIAYILLISITSLLGADGAVSTPTESIAAEHSEWSTGAEEADRFTSSLLNMLMTLLIFLGVIIFLSWVLKRMVNTRLPNNPHSDFKLLERFSLSPKTLLFVVEYKNKIFLLSESHATVVQIAEMDQLEDKE